MNTPAKIASYVIGGLFVSTLITFLILKRKGVEIGIMKLPPTPEESSKPND
jgi:hypothetical protein